MARKLQRSLTTATAAAVTSVGLVLATPSTVPGENVPAHCIDVAAQANYDAEKGPGNLALDKLAGSIIAFAAERCGNEEPGEHVAMKRLGYGTIRLLYARTVTDGGKEGTAGTYRLSATTVLTPDGLLSPVAATEMSATATASTPSPVSPAGMKDVYTMQGSYEFGAWEVMTTSDSEYGSIVDTDVADAGAANICGGVQAVMDDAAKGYSVAWQR